MTRPGAAAAVAGLAAVATLYAGIHWGSTVGGGADSYGYVSQASLWRAGRLTIREDIARQSPWPLALNTWAPLGYRPAPGSRDTIVPLYSPGLPLLMAAFQTLGGFCAALVVVPLCGACAVWLTYSLGRRLGASPSACAAAAVLVATSPVFLYQLMNPMSDVPATAAWTLAAVLTAGGSPLSAGAAAAGALVIRPNLVLVGLALLVWTAVLRRQAVRFLIGFAPGVLAVAAFNWALYGAPWTSGYGDLRDLYRLEYFGTNVRQFAAWMVQTQTPLALIAVLPLAAPRMLSGVIAGGGLLAASLIAAVVLSYAFYIPFDAWWYLRFLLPMWPALMVMTTLAGSALLTGAALRMTGGGNRPLRTRLVRAVGCLAVAALAANGVRIAADRSTFELSRGERRYVDVARFVAAHTESRAVMISLQHSGTLRLYAGRLTLRFDQLDGVWLDRVVAFLEGRGRRPYIVLDRGEIDLFRRQFASTNTGRLDWTPAATLDDTTFVFDASDRTATAAPLAIAATASRKTGWRCDAPLDERVLPDAE